MVRLWLTEGCPVAFSCCPALYEEARGWVASRLGVDAKEVTVVGSARVGYSLAKNYPAPFGPKSDLDLAIVSSSLFGSVRDVFARFVVDYGEATISPRNAREREYWDENLGLVPRNMDDGYLDVNKIPNLERYQVVGRALQTMWALTERLRATDDSPKPVKASVRIYKDWPSLVARVSLNLRVLHNRIVAS